MTLDLAPPRPRSAPDGPAHPGRLPRRFVHIRALDGLRGVAFLVVLAYHLLPSRIPSGGRVGVDLFFALSGFLITVLLRSEREKEGRVALGRFLRRRATRLFPALLAFLAAYLLLTALFGRDTWFGGVPGILGPAHPVTMAQSAHAAAGSLSYTLNLAIIYNWTWGIGAPVGHLWSLAVEGQFYLVWGPLLGLLLLRRHRLALPATLLLAAASVAATAVLWRGGTGAGWVYFLSWTRAQALLFGALAGLLWRPGLLSGRRWGPLAPVLAALAAVFLLAAVWVRPDHFSSPAATAAIAGVGTAGAFLVLFVASRPEGRVGRFLEAGWIGYVGRRSYALYLWHFVFLAWFRNTGPLGLALAVGLAFATAELSWRLVEQPALRLGRSRAGRVDPVSPGDAARALPAGAGGPRRPA